LEITFNITDELSGINYNEIVIKIDNENLFYDYIPYRDLVRCNLNKKLTPGTHTIEIYIEDKLNNSIYEKDVFYIE